MLPDLKTQQTNPPDGVPQLLIVARGDADALRAQDLPAPVLHDADRRVTRAFRAFPTPTAVLIDADGRIASPIATGAEQVFALANGGSIPTIAPPRAAAPEPLRVGTPGRRRRCRISTARRSP